MLTRFFGSSLLPRQLQPLVLADRRQLRAIQAHLGRAAITSTVCARYAVDLEFRPAGGGIGTNRGARAHFRRGVQLCDGQGLVVQRPRTHNNCPFLV
jgi:hypothetical protein